MRVILSGGGTGGHVYPALAICDGISRKYSDATFLYVGTEKGMENRIVKEYGMDFATINISGFDRSSMLNATKAFSKFPWSIKQAFNHIKSFKPDVVIGTGGYVSFPVVFAATYFPDCKTFIHEQNVYPGLANRLLSRRIDCALLTFDETAEYFSNCNYRVTGLPVRKEIYEVYERSHLHEKNFDSAKIKVTIFGGSLGSIRINKAVLEMISQHNLKDYKINWITGTDNYETIVKDFEKQIRPKQKNMDIEIFPYIYDMASVLAESHLVVCRAGASTISELTLLGIPAVFIPYPYASENHQEKNARALVEKNACEMIIDEFLDGNTLYNVLNRLMNDRNRLVMMHENIKKEAKGDALSSIINTIEEYLKN